MSYVMFRITNGDSFIEKYHGFNDIYSRNSKHFTNISAALRESAEAYARDVIQTPTTFLNEKSDLLYITVDTRHFS